MLRALLAMRGYRLRAIDKDLGSTKDFYFDDRLWNLRYLVADTGNWLPGRQVLIGQEALGRPDWEDQVFQIALSSGEIENSPGVESDLPFSLQKETELRTYYKWREYWKDEMFVQPIGYASSGVSGTLGVDPSVVAGGIATQLNGNPHLRSANEVQGYYINARDGDIGYVKDFVVTDDSWIIRYLIIDTKNWLPGKKVIVSPNWVKTIDWGERTVEIDMSREAIEQSPEFNPGEPINQEYEIRLYDYYGKPYDWE